MSKKDIFSNDYKRLVYDEILSNLIYLKTTRRIIRQKKKNKKLFKNEFTKIVLENFKYKLTDGQLAVLKEIEDDLNSNQRMFRLVQGDVGSGKTIIALISAAKVINSSFQVAFMAPTEILAKQHYVLAKKQYFK